MRIGVFVCQCGTNIAATVDAEAVAREAATFPDVVYATSYVYTCSQPGQDEIIQTIR
jgi:heterodisulfide reductase subunit A